MKLRFRANTLRLRVNQKEVEVLAAGQILEERIEFPGGTSLSYGLRAESAAESRASFANDHIQVSVPKTLISKWSGGDEIGLYFTLGTGAEPLKISIEKDLECIDGPLAEKDPNAFPRALGTTC